LAALDIECPTFEGWQQFVESREGRTATQIQTIVIDAVPAADLAVGRWITPAEKVLSEWDAGGYSMLQSHGLMQTRRLTLDPSGMTNIALTRDSELRAKSEGPPPKKPQQSLILPVPEARTKPPVMFPAVLDNSGVTQSLQRCAQHIQGQFK
jgi:hypothetical protein